MNNIQFENLFNRYKDSFFAFNYLFLSIVLVVGLSTGEIIMSIASIGLFLNWLIEGNYRLKHERAKALKFIPYALIIGYLSLLLWLVNTTNFDYAFNDLKVKLPILLFPLILGTIKLPKAFLFTIFRFFILGTLVSTLISFFVFLELIPIEKTIEDVRNISIFISHIRLSLLVCFTIVLLVFFIKKKQVFFTSYISFGVIMWLIYFLFILQAFTGLFILLVLSVLFLFYYLFNKKSKVYGLFAFVVFILFSLGVGYHVNTIYKLNFTPKPVVASKLDKTSKSGECYQHRLEDNWLENGNRVWLYVASNELKISWENRSQIPFYSVDKKGQPMWGTLYRYLTSKSLRKDKEGLGKLTDNEITLIENGQTNCCEKLTGLDKRVKDVLFQFQRYQNGESPNGHSIIQRIVYLKASANLLKSNFFFGVGLGDVNDEFMTYYENNNSKLIGKNRKRVHSQFMVFGVAMGVFGLVTWIVLLYTPFFKLQNNKAIYFFFLLIISISFLTDNTLERQAGVMFFSFFNSLLLFQDLRREG